MDNVPLTGTDHDGIFQRVLGYYDAPAYMRRARQVQAAYDDLLARCRQQRDEWLEMVRLRLGLLRALARDWEQLRPLLADEGQLDALVRLHADLDPQLRVPVEPTSSEWRLRRALRELNESIGGFNRRWQGFVERIDPSHVNELREGYNRYYLLEKECALRSPRVARLGFRPLGPLTTAELLCLLPPLPLFGEKL